MKKAFLLTALLLLVFTGVAQERHNYLAIDGELVDDIGPFYFIAQGDSQNAYALARPFAEALGATFRHEGQRLYFALMGNEISLAVTEDIQEGLERRSGVFIVNDQEVPSPMGILVAGQNYVAIAPVAKALGAEVEWDGSSRVIFVDLPREARFQRPVFASARQPVLNGPPVVGAHHERGFTRVVLQLPVGTHYSVAVAADRLRLTLQGVLAEPYRHVPEDPYLKGLQLTSVTGGAALELQTHHALDASGEGYALGLLPADEANPFERLYIDLGPRLRGAAFPALIEEMQVRVPEAHRITVVIDAGHGGRDSGAAYFGAREADIVLAIAQRLEALLETAGIEVIMTRNGDSYIELLDRADFANTDRNIFVSIHANAASDSEAHGIETWIFGQPLDDAALRQAIRENGGGEIGRALTAEAQTIAGRIEGNLIREEQLTFSRALAETVQGRLIKATGAADRGIKQSAFTVLQRARIPAILVEVGFLSSPSEGRKLITPQYQELLAGALAEGVLAFVDRGGALAEQ